MHHISILHAIILGIIQGATEFLPISSSGHLVLAQNLLGVDLEKEALLAFDIALHFGTQYQMQGVLQENYSGIFFWRRSLP